MTTSPKRRTRIAWLIGGIVLMGEIRKGKTNGFLLG